MTAITLPAWVGTLGSACAIAAGLLIVAIALVGTLAYFVDILTRDRVAQALRETRVQTPTPAPDTPARVPALDIQALSECYRKGHVYADWARTSTHWVCVNCGDAVKRLGDDEPFDQDAADLVTETEQHLRGVS